MFGLIRQPKDLLTGLLFIGFGAWFLFDALNYPLGTVRRMGPGWFPVAVSSLLIGTGALIALKSFFGERHELPRFSWATLALILVGLMAFAVLLRPAGVIAAVFALVMIVAFGHRPVKIPQMAAVAVGLGIFCAIVFIRLLGLPMTFFGTYVGW